MDKSRNGQKAPARPVGRLRNPRIGFIGKGTITEEEAKALHTSGAIAGPLGHVVVLIPGTAASNVVREGVLSVGGKLAEVRKNVIEQANHTMLYPDAPLLERLKKKYDLEKQNVTVIEPDQLVEWADALVALLPTGPANSEHQ